MIQSPLITAVQVTNALHLVITWSTGETLDCDLSTTISRHASLAPLADPAVFSMVAVEEWGHGLDWPDGLDMGVDRLYQLCREVIKKAA